MQAAGKQQTVDSRHQATVTRQQAEEAQVASRRQQKHTVDTVPLPYIVNSRQYTANSWQQVAHSRQQAASK